MRKLYGGVILFASIAALAIAVPVGAQTAARTRSCTRGSKISKQVKK